jgi:hypothetical protein
MKLRVTKQLLAKIFVALTLVFLILALGDGVVYATQGGAFFPRFWHTFWTAFSALVGTIILNVVILGPFVLLLVLAYKAVRKQKGM